MFLEFDANQNKKHFSKRSSSANESRFLIEHLEKIMKMFEIRFFSQMRQFETQIHGFTNVLLTSLRKVVTF